MNLKETECRAKDIFNNVPGGQQILLAAAAQIPESARLEYPEIAFQAAKVYINQGHHALAQAQLDIYLEACKNEPEKQARAYLSYAHMCNLEHDNDGLRHFVTKAQGLSQDEILLAECQYLLGEANITADPPQALKHYQNARRAFKRASATNRNAIVDVVRASLRIARVVFQQDMRLVGWQYLRYAEEAARQFAYSDLLSAVLLRTGEAWEYEGQYVQALSAYEEAVQKADGNPQKMAHLDYRRARLAILMNDDRLALDLLNRNVQSDHMYTICQWLLCQGWWSALQHELEDARRKLEGVEAIVQGEPKIAKEAHILRGLIAAQAGQVCEIDIRHLTAAADYFDEHRILIEAGQAKLILAWLHALAGDASYVAAVMNRLEKDIQRSGHVNHLARLYQVSVPLLGGWWQKETVATMEQALADHQSGGGVRVYAFGVPRVYVMGGELKQRDRYGHIGVRLLIYMLEKRQAQLWEIVEALWEGIEPTSGRKRFHTLMSNLKKLIRETDWCTYSQEKRMYIVKESFPRYYDADDFKATFDLLLRSDNTSSRLTYSLKLINLYDTFAKTFDGEAYEEFRHQYAARFDHNLLIAERILPELIDQVPSEWYEQLTATIAVKALSEQ